MRLPPAPVYEGSYGQRQIQAVAVRFERAPIRPGTTGSPAKVGGDGGGAEQGAESAHASSTAWAAFSDGVFAVAITLLVLNIEVPRADGDEAARPPRRPVPDVTAYFIAFAVIGLFWYGHHQAWSRLQRRRPRLVWSNLLLLSLIALMPFTTALMGGYGDEPISIVIYAANVGLAALADCTWTRSPSTRGWRFRRATRSGVPSS